MCCKEFLTRAVPFFVTFSIGLFIAGIILKVTAVPEPVPVVVEEVFEINTQTDHHDFRHLECLKEKNLKMELDEAVPPPPPLPPLIEPNLSSGAGAPPKTLTLPAEIRASEKE